MQGFAGSCSPCGWVGPWYPASRMGVHTAAGCQGSVFHLPKAPQFTSTKQNISASNLAVLKQALRKLRLGSMCGRSK